MIEQDPTIRAGVIHATGLANGPKLDATARPPVAVFDLTNIAGSVTARFAAGDELFTDLGSTGSASPEPSEVIFVDSNHTVSARRWCWLQSAQSATSATTGNALVVVEGHHDSAGDGVEAALTDLVWLLAAHQPHSQTMSYVPSPTNPGNGSSATCGRRRRRSPPWSAGGGDRQRLLPLLR